MGNIFRGNHFIDLLAQHRSQLFGYIFSIAQNLEDTRDIFQQTSLVLWRKFDDFDGDNFAGWACRTAQFEALNYLRSKRRGILCLSNEVLEELVEVSSETDDDALARQQALEGCLEKLPAQDRQLIDRCYSHVSSIKCVAEESGRSLQSVCNSLRRIRRALFDCVNRTMAREGR